MAVRLRAFLAFWYDFVIGDDWWVAAGVAAGLALTYLLSRAAVPAWWLLPLCLLVLLPLSLWRAARQQSAGQRSAAQRSAGQH